MKSNYGHSKKGGLSPFSTQMVESSSDITVQNLMGNLIENVLLIVKVDSEETSTIKVQFSLQFILLIKLNIKG